MIIRVNKILLAALFVSLISPCLASAAIITKVIEYKQGDTTLEGYLAYDGAGEKVKPGIIIFHEWMGLSPYEKSRAVKLAKLGYVAFAADVYGKGIRAKDQKAASELAGKYKSDRILLRTRVNAALDAIRARKNVDPKKIAAIGYCFGGTSALELARSGADMLGIVSFHGGLDTPNPDDAKNIKAKVLVLHGADDPTVSASQVSDFENEMRAAKVDWELVKYANAVHGFTNPQHGNDPSKGVAYNAVADARSWEAMKSFFNEIFR